MDLKKPVVVTGSSGFVGTSLVRTLRNCGFEKVIGVDLTPSPTTDFAADFGNSSLMAQIIPSGARVVHLGGVSTNGAAKADPLAAVSANCHKVLAFAESCRGAGVDQVIFASSEWVYGDPDNDDELLEGSGPIPYLDNSSLYAQTKLATEGFLKTSGFFENLTILRFAIVYGPRQTPLSAPESILSDCRANETVKVGNAMSSRRFIFIDDLVEGIIASLGFRGQETFNLPGPELVSLAEIYALACRIAGRDPGLIADGGVSPSIRNVSGERASRLLGWEARLTLEGCLKEIYSLTEGPN